MATNQDVLDAIVILRAQVEALEGRVNRIIANATVASALPAYQVLAATRGIHRNSVIARELACRALDVMTGDPTLSSDAADEAAEHSLEACERVLNSARNEVAVHVGQKGVSHG